VWGSNGTSQVRKPLTIKQLLLRKNGVGFSGVGSLVSMER